MSRRLPLACVAVMLCVIATRDAAGQAEAVPSAAMRLEDLERLALAGNPTVAQSEAAVRAMEARRRQAGRLPNPMIGYRGERLTSDHEVFIRQSEHAIFLEQTIVTGRKLKRSQEVAAAGAGIARADAEAQRTRVLNAVRMLYYDGLVAQRMVEVRRELARLGREAVGITAELLNVGQADQPDLLQAGIEADRMEIELLAAERELERHWEVLAAVVGSPGLPPARLEGDLEAGIPVLDREAVLAGILRDSPEMKAAQARVTWNRAAVARARSERIGNIELEAGADYDYDRSHGLGGWAAEFQMKFPLPLFDRRQGEVAAAQVESEAAALEVRRVELDLRSRMAAEFGAYEVARGIAEKYRTSILPKAEKAHRMYLDRFREMAASYPQVLIAQRTLAEARAEHLTALGSVWRHVVLMRGALLTGSLAGPGEGAMHAPSGTGSESMEEGRRP